MRSRRETREAYVAEGRQENQEEGKRIARETCKLSKAESRHEKQKGDMQKHEKLREERKNEQAKLK
jgi:hypothetical protein